jgi:GT2 family glycosyltransferase
MNPALADFTMKMSHFLEDLLIVIVLFKKKPHHAAAYTSIHTALNIFSSFPTIFIYDNSPEATPVESRHITYVHDPANSGVSKAYNEASLLALKEHKKWMLFLDQDTIFEESFFRKLTEALSNHPECVVFVPGMEDDRGLVSPFYFSAGRGKRLKVTRKTFSLKNYRFINSGLLINSSAFREAGGYDETIPLDFSDIYFGERLKKITDYFAVADIRLRHNFSSTAKLPLNEALTRFHYFCIGALRMGENCGKYHLYSTRTFLRSARLSFQYKNHKFLTIFLQHIAHG